MGGYSKKVQNEIAEGYISDYVSYRDAVLSGARIASQAEICKVQRQELDIANGVDGYTFDLNAAVRPLVWMACNLRFPLGAKRGKRFFLSPWQVYDTMVLFGWVSPEGDRRFSQAYIEVPRKNGKSTWMGGLLDYCAFGELKGVSCYIGATSLDQADETFSRASQALALAKHPNVKIQNSKNNKVIEFNGSKIMAIAAAPKDGKLAYMTVIDEYHQHKNNDLINSISSGNVSDQQALLIKITTAGTDLASPCSEEYKKCMKILDGSVSSTSYFISIYHPDENDSPFDEKTWFKANPNLGESVSLKKMQAIYENAQLSEEDMTTFMTKNLNIWVRGTKRWASMKLWEEKCKWTVDIESLYGKNCYCGLDLSSVYDFTAFTADFPTEEGHVQISHFWVAENQVDSITRVCKIPLRSWIKQGYVTATPGDVIDYDYVRDYLNEFYTQFSIQYIAVDRWHIDRMEAIMPPWFIEVEYEFSQYMKTMSQTTSKFERAYRQGEVTANGNPVLDWMMSCCDIKYDSSGNGKLIKADKHESRIDGVITSIMAYDCADVHGCDEDSAIDYSTLSFF